MNLRMGLSRTCAIFQEQMRAVSLISLPHGELYLSHEIYSPLWIKVVHLYISSVREISKERKRMSAKALIMSDSGLLLILTFMFISSSVQATLANCPACMGEQPDWTQSATAFLEGKPTQDAPSTLSGPQQARLLNAQIDAKKKASQASNEADNTTAMLMQNLTASFDIDLFEIRAMPNPANFNDEVEIMAVFGIASSNSTTPGNPAKIIDLTNLTVYAEIINSSGLNVAKINLKPSSENGYIGIWNASVESDIYNATIEVSGPDGSKTFNDALQIVIGTPGMESF